MRVRDWKRLLDAAESDAAELRARLNQAERVLEQFAKPPGLMVVRVNQTEGRPTIEGLLVSREPVFRLTHASLIEGEGRSVPLDHTVEILREHVALTEVIGRSADA